MVPEEQTSFPVASIIQEMRWGFSSGLSHCQSLKSLTMSVSELGESRVLRLHMEGE